MKFQAKDIIYIVVLIIAAITSYYSGQMKTASEIEKLHLIVKDNERDIAVGKMEVKTIKEGQKQIISNQKTQNEKSDKIYGLFYSYVSSH